MAVVALTAAVAWVIMAPSDLHTPPLTVQIEQPLAPRFPSSPPGQPLDQALFASAKLWNPQTPPPQPTATAAAPSPEPLNLQLIGIISEAGERRAAIYDISQDRILIVASGDKVRTHTVTLITDKTIELSDGRNTHTLTLVEGHS